MGEMRRPLERTPSANDCWCSPGRRPPSPSEIPHGPAAPRSSNSPPRKLNAVAKDILKTGVGELSDAQELLWASDTYALLVVFQALDAAGKDSTIEHVMSGVNPQGVQVVSFRQPSSEDFDHDFVWRIYAKLPERGRIGIFNRSHYEKAVALRVHPEWLKRQRIPGETNGEAFWRERYDVINALERHLDRNVAKVIKASCTYQGKSRSDAFSPGWTHPGKRGSSTHLTSSSVPTGTNTCRRSTPRSRRRPPRGHRGTSSRRTTSR
jgi:polyphosphate kinase 2 (PPK2 family)